MNYSKSAVLGAVVFPLATFVACSMPATRPPATESASTSPRTPAAPLPADAALQASLDKLAAESDGIVAVTVRHLQTGVHASVHGDRRLPMMSVFKLPLAIVALSLVEEGKLTLDQQVPIAESELRPGVSPIADAWKDGPRSVTVKTLIVRAIQDSDNTAGDKLVTLEGGGGAITQRLRKLGVAGVDIGEQEIEIFARAHCPGATAPKDGWTFPLIDACPKPTPEARLVAAQKEIESSPNAASSDGLVGMLAAIDGAAIEPHRAWLRDVLAGTKTGTKRLKSLLPEGTRVEHKTGTGEDHEGLNIATNDVGVIVLPDGGRVAIAVLTAGSRKPQSEREALIARLAKATWDRFVP